LGVTLHNDICLPYFLRYCTEEQRERWLPGIVSGGLITAIAMTEPGIGSDLAGLATRARREGDGYVVDGTKTFITNGINADLVINPPQERLSLAASAVAAAGTALSWTLGYARERHAFGQPIGSFQSSRFTLAELRTEVEIARTYTDRCTQALDADELTPEDA